MIFDDKDSSRVSLPRSFVLLLTVKARRVQRSDLINVVLERRDFDKLRWERGGAYINHILSKSQPAILEEVRYTQCEI